MGLFEIFKKKETRSDLNRITTTDRAWIEDSFRMLIQVFGYPFRDNKQIQFTEDNFPKTFAKQQIDTQVVLEDLCKLMSLDKNKITVEIHTDLRDIPETPYEFQDQPFESDLEKIESGYCIHLSNQLKNHTGRLINRLVYECIFIRLAEDHLDDGDLENMDLFVYLVAIFQGFGVLLSIDLNEVGFHSDGIWERRWIFSSDMPIELMSFGLALFSTLIEDESPDWLEGMSGDFKKLYQGAKDKLEENPTELYSKEELNLNDVLVEGDKLYDAKEFTEAIERYREIISLTSDDFLKVHMYNNIGYSYLKMSDYKQSIVEFEKGLEIDPEASVLYDNIGYSWLKLKDTERAKLYIDKAIEKGGNDPSYTCRNMALYYDSIGNTEKAQAHYDSAFKAMTSAVDFLYCDYNQFLIKHGRALPSEYNLHKIKDGKLYTGRIRVTIEFTEGNELEIVELCKECGWQGQELELPEEGFELFKEGICRGLRYAHSKLTDKKGLKVYVWEASGGEADANPTIYGYLGIKALLEVLYHGQTQEEEEAIEQMLCTSWDKDPMELPDFMQVVN